MEGSLFCSQGMRDTVNCSGWLLVSNKRVSPTLFLPLTNFGFKGNLPQAGRKIFPPGVTLSFKKSILTLLMGLLLVSRQPALHPSLECTYALFNKLLLFKSVLSLSLDWILSFKKTRIRKMHCIPPVTVWGNNWADFHKGQWLTGGLRDEEIEVSPHVSSKPTILLYTLTVQLLFFIFSNNAVSLHCP